MSLAHKRPAEFRKPDCKILPDERKQLTRYRELNHGHQVKDDLIQAWGTVDTGPATGETAGFAGLRLVDQYLDGEYGRRAAAVPVWVEVYETLPATAEQLVGRRTRILLEDGRDAWEYNYLQFTAGTYVPGTVGTSTAPDSASLYLQREEAGDDGCLRRIKRTYVEAGILSTDYQESANGRLLRYTIVSAKTVPSTPSGYALVGSPVQHPDGLPIYSYTYFKGLGEVSRRTSRGQNAEEDDGTLGSSRLDIEYLTAPAASEPAWSSVSGYTKLIVTKQERDGHMVWSAIFGKGVGLVAQLIAARQDGLREVTNIALGTRDAPDGAVIRDDYRNDDGYIVYTVTAMQTAAGGSNPTTATMVFERYMPFTYPGRAKAFTETYDGKTMLSHFESPPVSTLVKATVTISYQTGNTLGTISDFWNPSDWATVKAQWTGAYGVASSQIKALPGYRTVSSTPVTLAGSGYDATIYGHNIYASTTARITVTGGPANPDGNTYTLHAEIEPAFTDADGTKYYRKTLVSATIPAQASLPV